jgi:hypothetical protein
MWHCEELLCTKSPKTYTGSPKTHRPLGLWMAGRLSAWA